MYRYLCDREKSGSSLPYALIWQNRNTIRSLDMPDSDYYTCRQSTSLMSYPTSQWHPRSAASFDVNDAYSRRLCRQYRSSKGRWSNEMVNFETTVLGRHKPAVVICVCLCNKLPRSTSLGYVRRRQ
nr:hypothetical protein CFP56_50804 [Quercus suber]